MKKICTLLALFWVGGVSAAEVVDQSSIIGHSVNQFMIEHAVPGMAIEIYNEGKPQSYYFGVADDVKKLPITKQTIFELGSISKIMTSILLAQEFDAAKMQLKSSVKTYLPLLSEEFDDITLQNLATHTSGLPFEVPADIKNQSEFEKYLAAWYPEYVAGEEWIYSNIGIGLLGDAIQKTAHKDIDELYHKQIFSILGMQSSGLTVPKGLQKYYAQGHDEKGQSVLPITQDLFYCAYGVKASSADMQKFLKAAIGLPGTPESILYPMRLTQAGHVKIADKMQGFGWQMQSVSTASEASVLLKNVPSILDPLPVIEIYSKPVFKGDMLIEKTGRTDGFSSYIALIPNKKTGIVILMNKQVKDRDIVILAREMLFKLANINTNPIVENSESINAHA